MSDFRPYSVNVELTLACNLRCRHCGSAAGRARPAELGRDELARCFSALVEIGGEEVCLLGGEPLLRRDWEAVAMDVGEAGLRLALVTNGWLVDDAQAARIASMPHLDRVGVSLDGASASVHDGLRGRSGAHERALGALLALRDAGVEACAITTLSKANLGELGPLRDLLVGRGLSWQIQLANLGGERFDPEERLTRAEYYEVGRFISACRRRFSVDELPVAGAHDLGYNSEALGQTGELDRWRGCGAGLYTLGIMSDGRVKACLSQHDDLIVGSLRERSLAELWADPELFSRNRRFSPDLLEGQCQGCPHGATCRAGCWNVCYTTTGRHYDNPYCFYRIEREGRGDGDP